MKVKAGLGLNEEDQCYGHSWVVFDFELQGSFCISCHSICFKPVGFFSDKKQ